MDTLTMIRDAKHASTDFFPELIFKLPAWFHSYYNLYPRLQSNPLRYLVSFKLVESVTFCSDALNELRKKYKNRHFSCQLYFNPFVHIHPFVHIFTHGSPHHKPECASVLNLDFRIGISRVTDIVSLTYPPSPLQCPRKHG